MKYLFDTDTLIYLLKGNKNIALRVSETPIEAISTTIINYTELLYGALKSDRVKQNLNTITTLFNNLEIITFCKECAFIFAEEKAKLKNKGNLIADLDLMIASIAIHHKKILVTNNFKHFDRLTNLEIDNWS